MQKKWMMLLLVILLMPAATARSGSMKLLAVTNTGEEYVGSVADLDLEIKPGSGRVFIDSYPLSKLDTQISTRFAKEVACNFIDKDCSRYDFFYRIRSRSSLVGGPSAGAGIAVLTAAVLEDLPINDSVSITGTINSGGIIGQVGGVPEKIDAAAENEIGKVLIPKYMRINTTNISAENSIEIVEVSHIGEAIRETTGVDYSGDGNIELNMDYISVMKDLSVEICERATGLAEQHEPDNDYYANGISALEEKRYYSAASYCFAASVGLRYQDLLAQNMSARDIRAEINETLSEATRLRANIAKVNINTITDLETYMVVSSRITEAEDRLHEIRTGIDTSNSTIYNLAFGIERLNTAWSWSNFFNTFGTEYNIDKHALNISCQKKISEVEERAQYIDLYVPGTTREIREAIHKSTQLYENGNPELCLYEASIAKAEADIILNTVAINQDYVDEVIEDRLEIVYSLIAKQTTRGVFPIVAYSYYEYAGSLKEEDPASALLYLEYALELGNLDIYFEEKGLKLPAIDMNYIILFVLGLITGAAASALYQGSKSR